MYGGMGGVGFALKGCRLLFEMLGEMRACVCYVRSCFREYETIINEIGVYIKEIDLSLSTMCSMC